MKHTEKDIWEAMHVIIGYNSQLSLEHNEAKYMEQTGSEGDRISKDWAAMSSKHATLDI